MEKGHEMLVKMQRSELIADMQSAVPWNEFRSGDEAQHLHRQIVSAANLVFALAPQALRLVRVRR